MRPLGRGYGLPQGCNLDDCGRRRRDNVTLKTMIVPGVVVLENNTFGHCIFKHCSFTYLRNWSDN